MNKFATKIKQRRADEDELNAVIKLVMPVSYEIVLDHCYTVKQCSNNHLTFGLVAALKQGTGQKFVAQQFDSTQSLAYWLFSRSLILVTCG